MEVTMTINGERNRFSVQPHETLAAVLRDKAGCTDVKIGCGNGECGACTVLLDGQAVASCILPAVKADGKEVLTARGLARNGELDLLQRKFMEHEAVQCGYCTPGMLMSAKALLNDNPKPTEADVRLAISGNICRCTGYDQIVEAVLAAAAQSGGKKR